MPMQVMAASLPGIYVIEPVVFPDQRGFFLESYRRERYAAAGLNWTFVQDNHSRSRRNVVRGMHYQLRHPQGKLVYVVSGEVFDVALDIRRGSPNFGQCFSILLTDSNHKQVFVSPGFAHGFCVLSETADVIYKCTEVYFPEDEYGVHWSSVNVDWPVSDPVLSAKDDSFPLLSQIPESLLPSFS